MNAQQEVTPAILMPCVTTPRDRTTAHAKRDLLVMASTVQQVRGSLSLWLCPVLVAVYVSLFVYIDGQAPD